MHHNSAPNKFNHNGTTPNTRSKVSDLGAKLQSLEVQVNVASWNRLKLLCNPSSWVFSFSDFDTSLG